MTTLNFRVTGPAAACEAVINRLAESELIHSIEEVDGMMSHMDDEDSSSAGLAENIDASVYDIRVHTDDHSSDEEVRRMAELTVRSSGAMLEETDRF